MLTDTHVLVMLMLLVAAVWHSVYETILAPSLRTYIRNRLFEQRDKLRRSLIEKRIHGDAFNQMQESINLAICIQDQIRLIDLYSHRRKMQLDTPYRNKVEKRSKRLEKHSDDTARAIQEKTVKLISYALAINSGAWAPYLVALVVPIIVMAFAFNHCKNTVEQAVRPLLITPLSAESIIRGHFAIPEKAPAH